jgi:hypothetical protein
MRLTADVITNCFARINPCLERELDLRGLKIPAIENIGATQVGVYLANGARMGGDGASKESVGARAQLL